MKKILLSILICAVVLASAGSSIFFYTKYQQSEELNHYHSQVNKYLIWNNIRNKIHFDIAQLGGETLRSTYPNYDRSPGFTFKWFVEVPQTEEKAFESYADGLEDYLKKYLTLLVKRDMLSKPGIRVSRFKKDRGLSHNGIPFTAYDIEVTFEGMTYLPLNAEE